MKSKDCYEIQKLSQSIRDWKQNTESTDCKLGTIQRSDACSIEISACLPNNIKGYIAKNPTEAGPNCFNAGLVFLGLLPNLRFSTADEVNFYMNSALCRKRNPGEQPMTGDLGLISMAGREQSHSAQHAFIYLSEDFVYEKPDQHKESPFTIVYKNKTFVEYGLDSNTGTPNENPIYKGIDRKLTYYSCISAREYLGDKPDVPDVLLKLWNEIDVVEKCFEEFTMTHAPFTLDARKNILDVAKALTSYLKNEKNTDGNHDKEKSEFMIASLQLKLKAISENLSPTRKIVKTDADLSKFAETLKKSLDQK
ncbi:MAG: hypothetical protein JNL11_00160 [Bdellovibrionaceae bacterium]|nr:hypothetical protein [Pseudobdellovibrionaceae bacterium]